jgi:hypothetical protein
MWKPEEEEAFVKTLLIGDTLIDPISIGRHTSVGRTTEGAINGNNRLRCIWKFVNNRLGVRSPATDGRISTYYYSEIPPTAARRTRPQVLTPDQRNAFDEYPILFNCRPDLTEAQEIAWYRDLNTSLHAHTTGHLLVADICAPALPAMRCFADALVAQFPAVKDRIAGAEDAADADSIGTFLAEMSRCEANFLSDDDKRENTLLSHAVIANLLVNGLPFSESWKGVFNSPALEENVDALREIFTTATISHELFAEWASPLKTKPYMQLFYSPTYLLGPIAWSLGTKKPGAVATWVRFLSSARPGTITETYGNRLAELKLDDGNANKYRIAWEQVLASMA